MLRVLLIAGVMLPGCSDYNFGWWKDEPELPTDTEAPPPDSEPPGDTEPPIDTEPPVEEECNGEDDDGDGLVDEGFDDTDGDGIADCVDDDCTVDEHPGGAVEQVAACDGTVVEEVVDPWNVTIEWQWTSDGSGVVVMPAVGNLTDDNGDGLIDEHDTPDIAFTDWTMGDLVALHGDGSGEIFRTDGFIGISGVTIADVDGDGMSEVIGLTSDYEVVAVDGTGAVEWTSDTFILSSYPQPAVADLDGDGEVEVVYDSAVVSGADGSTLFQLSGITTSYRAPVVADLDADGTQEIILGEGVFSHTGALEWSVSTGYTSAFAAVADLNGDAVASEVVMAIGSSIGLYEHDGSLLRTIMLPGSHPGPPSVADFDGDGEVEIAVAAGGTINMWEVNGVMRWSQPISDSSGMAGCSGYDIDGDGAYELLYADEQRFHLYDGASGTEHYSNGSHDSATLWEYPVTADVDGDGSAEIVIASNGLDWHGITVFGHAGDGWQPSGPTWGTHDYSHGNLDPDGGVPNPPPLPWEGHNVFRARPVVDGPAYADLTVAVEDVCVASCEDGPVKLSFAVANQGYQPLQAGVSVALYAVASDGKELIDTMELDELPAGQAIAGGVFELGPDEWGERGVLLRVDDDGEGVGQVTECDETNNEAEYSDMPCE